MEVDFIEIPLSNGQVARVSPGDYPDLSKYNWHVNDSGYVHRKYRSADGKQRQMYMHRQIMGISEFPVIDRRDIDHINHNGLDNRRDNLRFATESQNMGNMLAVRRNNTSGFKGVYWNNWANKWHAQIRHNGHSKHIGYFSNKLEAAAAYNCIAIEQWGEFALLNDLTEHKS